MTKICNYCGIEKDEAEFTKKTVNGKKYLAFICKSCETKYKRTMPGHTGQMKRHTEKVSDRLKLERKDPQFRAKYICQDSKKSDKKFGRETDLDVDFVQQKISQGCFYCGETGLQMTLDRVDNSLGHLKSNVLPCCLRCNYTRKDMPFEAWIVVASGMRKAREFGLFGSWTNKAR